jgi:hypothetical protein
MTATATVRKFGALTALGLTFILLTASSRSPGDIVIAEEHVTGGALDLPWLNGFGVSSNMTAVTLPPEHPGYDNPSGDHTVACAITSITPDSGGIVLTAIDPQGIDDYLWEARVFTGDGNSRRGLVVRADPNNQFATHYQFVMQQGLAQFAFRKLENGMPTMTRAWFAGGFPGGVPQLNTWHHMAISADDSTFRCYWDGFEVTSQGGAIMDSVALASGWVGVYNFRFDIGRIPFYTDDLILTALGATPAHPASWGEVRRRWR